MSEYTKVTFTDSAGRSFSIHVREPVLVRQKELESRKPAPQPADNRPEVKP